MRADWPETPLARKLVAERLDGTRMDYKHLKVGDVFRPVRALTGTYHNLETGAVDADCYCRVNEPPEPSGCGEGYGCFVTFGTRAEIVK